MRKPLPYRALISKPGSWRFQAANFPLSYAPSPRPNLILQSDKVWSKPGQTDDRLFQGKTGKRHVNNGLFHSEPSEWVLSPGAFYIFQVCALIPVSSIKAQGFPNPERVGIRGR